MLILPPGRHFGSQLHKWESNSFTVSEIKYAGGTRTPLHGNEQALLVFVESGGYAKTSGRDQHECMKNQIIFIPAQQRQADLFCSSETRCLVVDLSAEFLRRLDLSGVALNNIALLSGIPFTSYGSQLVRELRQTDSVSAIAFEGLLLNILVRGTRCAYRLDAAKVPAWLLKAKELLHDRFLDSVTIESIAIEVGIHPVNLSQAFRRFFNTTAAEYLRERRIEFAARLLAMTDRPLAEIAIASGFSDQAHFARTFRRITNLTPSEYRKITRY